MSKSSTIPENQIFLKLWDDCPGSWQEFKPWELKPPCSAEAFPRSPINTITLPTQLKAYGPPAKVLKPVGHNRTKAGIVLTRELSEITFMHLLHSGEIGHIPDRSYLIVNYTGEVWMFSELDQERTKFDELKANKKIDGVFRTRFDYVIMSARCARAAEARAKAARLPNGFKAANNLSDCSTVFNYPDSTEPMIFATCCTGANSIRDMTPQALKTSATPFLIDTGSEFTWVPSRNATENGNTVTITMASGQGYVAQRADCWIRFGQLTTRVEACIGDKLIGRDAQRRYKHCFTFPTGQAASAGWWKLTKRSRMKDHA